MGKVIHWELCKKLKFDHMNKWCMHNPKSVLENETHRLLWDFRIQTDHLILACQLDLIIINKKKRTCQIVNFAVLAEHRVKLKREISTSTLPKNWKNWNMKVTVMPIRIDALGTVTRGLIKGLEDLEIRGWVETIQTTALFRLVRILRRDRESCGDLLSLKLQWETIS